VEKLAYPSAYFNDGKLSTQNVYVAFDPIGTIIGVYQCIETAIDKCAGEVSNHFCEQVHVEVSDVAIFVEGEKGKVTILIEDLK
jgi:hypothetical protein